MRPTLPAAVGILACALALPAHAQGFAALVSPPRFELKAPAGKTLRAVFEISNRSTAPAKFFVRTADWTLGPDLSVAFSEELAPGSCRPWVAIERPEVVVPGAGTMRYRFEVAVPPDAVAGECRFAIMIEGAEPSISHSQGLDVPVTGRIGLIVYVAVAGGAPELEVFGPKVAMLNGKRVPTLRVYNRGNAHGRISGFLTGKDARGVAYDFMPSDFPILPGEQRDVFLTPSTPTDDHPTLTYPVTVKGQLEWGDHTSGLEQIFE